MPDWLQAIDWTALHWIRDTLHCGFLDLLMPAITALGNGGIIWLIAAAALSVSKKYRKYGIVLFAALAAALIGILISTAAMCLMKAWIRAPREINGQGASADSSAQKRPDSAFCTVRPFLHEDHPRRRLSTQNADMPADYQENTPFLLQVRTAFISFDSTVINSTFRINFASAIA